MSYNMHRMARNGKPPPRPSRSRVRNLKALGKLVTIAAKLRFTEPLDPEESVFAGNLLRLIAANQDPRPAFYEPQ